MKKNKLTFINPTTKNKYFQKKKNKIFNKIVIKNHFKLSLNKDKV